MENRIATGPVKTMTTIQQTEPAGLPSLESVDLAQIKIDPVWSGKIPASGARRFRTIALCQVKEDVIVATCNSGLAMVRDYVSKRIQTPFRLVRVDEAAFRRLLNQVYPRTSPAVNSDSDGESCETVEACDELLRAALLRGASDIHLMPGETAVRTRFRVDGVLEDFLDYPVTLREGLVSRIKVLAGMNIAEKREPQDGRFSINCPRHEKSIDIRVATIPTRYGERVTLRLLAPIQATSSLEALGMGPDELEIFRKAIDCSHGLVLLTGPTGCGKSTTLYTAITNLLNSRGGNVITVEDPIEYEIPGTSQVEVDTAKKVTFARALRSILRHDPDVIMLGEIRDRETAELAIKAALTGHLVLSTLHTNTAAGVVTRLIDMGVQPFLVAATLRLAVAQRLVRQLCPRCRRPEAIGTSKAKLLGNVEFAGRTGFVPSGCVYCAGKGYVGRSALFEMLPGGSTLSELICRGVSESELIEHMTMNGYRLLIEDGMNKVVAGTTTAQQVLNAVAMW